MPAPETVARFLVALGAVLVLGAVGANFLTARNRAAMASERRSPVATATMTAFFVALWAVLRLGLSARRPPAAALWGGVALVAAGTALNILGRIHLGRAWGDHVVVWKDHPLVERGPYRFIRHPLYAGLIAMGAGAALVFGNPLALGLVLLVFAPAMAWRARQEERELERSLPGYREYRRRTGMFLPRP